MDIINVALSLILLFWIVGFGLAMIFHKPNQYLEWSGKIAESFYRYFVIKPTRFVWKNYPSQVVCIIIGMIFTLIVLKLLK